MITILKWVNGVLFQLVLLGCLSVAIFFGAALFIGFFRIGYIGYTGAVYDEYIQQWTLPPDDISGFEPGSYK